MVRRTVFMYNQAGAAGLHIEDQVFPKKCGHLDGKKLINIDEMERKIKAAVEASKTCSDGNFLVCARTDARSVEGKRTAERGRDKEDRARERERKSEKRIENDATTVGKRRVESSPPSSSVVE